MPHKAKKANNEYWRNYHKRKREEGNPLYLERVRARARRAAKGRRDRIRAIIRLAKDKPCVDCKQKFPPEVMDLDHVRGEKTFTISKLINGALGYVSIERLNEELAKCDPRCPTCHRMRHYNAGDFENLRKSRTKSN